MNNESDPRFPTLFQTEFAKRAKPRCGARLSDGETTLATRGGETRRLDSARDGSTLRSYRFIAGLGSHPGKTIPAIVWLPVVKRGHLAAEVEVAGSHPPRRNAHFPFFLSHFIFFFFRASRCVGPESAPSVMHRPTYQAGVRVESESEVKWRFECRARQLGIADRTNDSRRSSGRAAYAACAKWPRKSSRGPLHPSVHFSKRFSFFPPSSGFNVFGHDFALPTLRVQPGLAVGWPSSLSGLVRQRCCKVTTCALHRTAPPPLRQQAWTRPGSGLALRCSGCIGCSMTVV